MQEGGSQGLGNSDIQYIIVNIPSNTSALSWKYNNNCYNQLNRETQVILSGYRTADDGYDVLLYIKELCYTNLILNFYMLVLSIDKKTK